MRKWMGLTVLMALAASLAQAQSVAPFGPGSSDRVVVAPPSGDDQGRIYSREELNAILGGAIAATTDDFEAFNVADGGAVSGANTVLDESTVYMGQGPGLVNDGARYLTAVNLQWDGAGYYGMPSRNILSNSGDATITISYDTPTGAMGVDLHTFNGFADTVTAYVYDGSGGLVYTSPAMSVPDANPVFFGYTYSSIGSVRLTGGYSWGPLIDNHTYGGACNGTEFIKKAKCKVKNGAVKKAIVLVSNTTSGQDYTCDLATGQSLTVTASTKAKFTFKGGNAPPLGANTATVCGVSQGFTCQ